MIIKEGNLLEQKGYLFHQTNCKFVMGSGIALQIRNTFPKVYNSYISFGDECRKNGISPLGTYQVVELEDCKVVNVFSQDSYGKTGLHTDYAAMENSFQLFANNELSGIYNFPYLFGCGTGGGDWKIVSEIIERYFPDAIIWKYNS
jgi:hypothetical protein